MTLPEKLGQLTMTTGGYAVTGPARVEDPSGAIIAGTIGNLLQCGRYGRRVQDAASGRRGVATAGSAPHRFRCHSRTSHLVSGAARETALFDAATWATQRGAKRRSRRAPTAVAMTIIAPMLDVSRDPRWAAAWKARAKTHGSPRASPEAKVRRLPGCRSCRARCAKPRSPSTSAPMDLSRPGATTPRWTFRSARCTRSTCRPLLRRLPQV